MRANLLCGRGGVSHLIDEDTRHSLPIGQMGNYQDYLKKQPMPLRELESAPVRQHMFGNPFKTNKNLMMMTDEVSGLGGVDEVQIVSPGAPLSVQQRGVKRAADQALSAPPKRRKGPLAKDFQFSSPAASPVYTPEIAEINLNLEPVQPTYKLPVVNGVKPVNAVGKMNSFYSDDVEILEDSDLKLIEEVKPLDKAEALKISNYKNEPSSNNVLKKIDLIRNDVTKSIADTILSNLTEVQEPSLKPWHPNGQTGPAVYHKPDIFITFAKEIPDIHANSQNSLDDTLDLKPLVPGTAELEEPKTAAASAPEERRPSEEELRSIKLRNNNVRQLIYKEVKRPGKCHSLLWKMLDELYGPPWVRRQFIQEVKQEALRSVAQPHTKPGLRIRIRIRPI